MQQKLKVQLQKVFSTLTVMSVRVDIPNMVIAGCTHRLLKPFICEWQSIRRKVELKQLEGP